MMTRGLIVLALLAANTQDASGQLFRRSRSYKVVVRTQVVPVVPVVQTLFLVAPPSFYGAATYTPPSTVRQETTVSRTQEQIVDTLTKVVEALAVLELRMDRIEGIDGHGDNGVVPVDDEVVPVQPPEPVVVIPRAIKESCGKCHTRPEAKGDFWLAMLLESRRNLMARAMVANSKMPLDAHGDPATITPALRAKLLHILEGMNR